jgi:ADP-ribosylation factor protein 1
VKCKNIQLVSWDVGGRDRLRPISKHFIKSANALIYIVDSADRENIAKARDEFFSLIKDEAMENACILVFANKQDIEEAMSVEEVSEKLELSSVKNNLWFIHGCSMITGDGLFEGLDWLSSRLSEKKSKSLKQSS